MREGQHGQAEAFSEETDFLVINVCLSGFLPIVITKGVYFRDISALPAPLFPKDHGAVQRI